jgi:predicted nicotinamide N-methyase
VLKNRKLYKALIDNTIIKSVTIRQQTFRLECILDSEKLLNTISESDFQEDERLPYWAELWPSSLALAEYLLENRDLFVNKELLELGCGLGLGGMAAHTCGARVLFSDYETLALHFTQRNFHRNFKQLAQVTLLDWRNISLKCCFDIIIAADILYEVRLLLPVFNLLSRILLPGGLAIIAEPNRTVAQEFFKLVTRNGWSDKGLLKNVKLDHKLHRVTIHRIRRC